MDEHYFQILIKKLWDGTASRKECAELLDYLENSRPAEGGILPIEPWAGNQNADLPGDQSGALQDDVLEKPGILSTQRREDLLKSIERKIGSRKQPKVVSLSGRWLKASAACAALIAIGFIAYFMIAKINSGYVPIAPQMAAASISHFDTISNNGAGTKTIHLADASTVILYPGSKIWFRKGEMDRAIALTGKAYFKIKHNAQRVFTVTTGDIMTTDIGTEFEIDAHKQNRTAIRLVKGKVKVGSAANSKLQMQDQYLNRGDLLNINITGERVELAKISGISKVNKAEEPLVFNRTPLEEVFGKISEKYKANIHFEARDVSQLTFTGNVEPNDSLFSILNIICSINNLTLSKDSTGFIIKKN